MSYTNRSCCGPRNPRVGVLVGRDKFYSSGETATLLLEKGNMSTAMGAHNTNPCRSFAPKRNQDKIKQGISEEFAPPLQLEG